MKIPLCADGPDPHLEPDAITQTFGVLAMRGAGKSNLAAVMAEGMFDAGLPFVVVDPVGSWFGLRSELAIPIFGGRHGDVPLEKTGGTLIADLVVDQRLTCILDVSEMSEGDKTRFLIDFAERLYHKNTEPLHLFLEEADDFCPQRPFREQARLVRAWENVVRRGRARGLGMTMITQRSAALNKNVLTQVETLFVLRTTSPQDRKAIEAWVTYHGQSGELLKSLAELETGEAWVWSPQYLKTLKRFRVRQRRTFDSGATPKGGASRKPATLADVNIAAVAKAMALTIERAKAVDPRELQKTIHDLQRELAATKGAVKEKRVEVPVLDKKTVERLETMFLQLANFGRKFEAVADDLLATVRKAAAPDPGTHTHHLPFDDPAGLLLHHPPRGTMKLGNVTIKSGDLTDTQRRVLTTVVMLKERGIKRSRIATARWMGIHPNGGRYLQDCARLREKGLLNTVGMDATPDGVLQAEGFQTGELAALSAIEQSDGARRTMMEAIIKAKCGLKRTELAELLGIHPNGGRFLQNLARLREMELIPDRGEIVALDGTFR
jgi:hypothetical protein